MKQKGQVIIVLLLVMVVTLAVALSIIGRSINEISTSTKTEDSSRAFSAAEAGIEKVLKLATPPGSTVNLQFDNRATASAEFYKLPVSTNALEHPPIGKASFAQIWLAQPEDNNNDGLPDGFYGVATNGAQPKSFRVYWGIPQIYTNLQDLPAIEVNTIVWNSATSTPRFESRRKWFDTMNPINRGNNFTYCDPGDYLGSNYMVTTNNNSIPTPFLCSVTVEYAGDGETVATSSGVYPIMARVRILYSNLNHPVAVGPLRVADPGYNSNDQIPLQANIYTSLGEAGDVQRRLQVFRQKEVMPHFFDFVLFSEAEISK